MTKLTIWGGAGEHGRSSYLLQGKESCILLDCGVKKEGKGEYPLLDAAVIPQLQAVFLSHAHEDHSMALPLLYKYGYKGKVWTTRDTFRQLPGYFEAWSRYTAAESAGLPYGDEDKQAMEFMFLDEQAGPRLAERCTRPACAVGAKRTSGWCGMACPVMGGEEDLLLR